MIYVNILAKFLIAKSGCKGTKKLPNTQIYSKQIAKFSIKNIKICFCLDILPVFIKNLIYMMIILLSIRLLMQEVCIVHEELSHPESGKVCVSCTNIVRNGKIIYL